MNTVLTRYIKFTLSCLLIGCACFTKVGLSTERDQKNNAIKVHLIWKNNVTEILGSPYFWNDISRIGGGIEWTRMMHRFLIYSFGADVIINGPSPYFKTRLEFYKISLFILLHSRIKKIRFYGGMGIGAAQFKYKYIYSYAKDIAFNGILKIGIAFPVKLPILFDSIFCEFENSQSIYAKYNQNLYTLFPYTERLANNYDLVSGFFTKIGFSRSF